MGSLLREEAVFPGSFATTAEYFGQRSNVCAKVLNRAGEVVAVNRRGLELLQAQCEDVCGKVWTEFWDGEHKAKAEEAVHSAFQGQTAAFVGTFYGTGEKTLWEIEIFPLEKIDDHVATILVVSCNITALIADRAEAKSQEDEADLVSKLSETLHSISNVVSVANSTGRVLRRKKDDPVLAQIADGLDATVARAEKALADLRKLLGA